ncbi:hypothetical protein ANAEL_04628 [Anaerolineales bacterium]|nr:hypothetical protein ANAEL_04628 [Anaerolineales bacterium]
MTRAAFRAGPVEQRVGRWRKGIASNAMAIVRSHDDTAGGEMSFTAAPEGPKKASLLARTHPLF